MSIFKHRFSPEQIFEFQKDTLAGHLGIEVYEVGEDYLAARMPVDSRTVQPFRILHGGASVALSETLGSIASTMCIEDWSRYTAVGLEINANHLKSVPEGQVITAVCRPVRVGKHVHVWSIEIRDEKGALSCISRLTVAIVERRGHGSD